MAGLEPATLRLEVLRASIAPHGHIIITPDQGLEPCALPTELTGLNNKNKTILLHRAGFEPALPKEPDLKSGALDHSATDVYNARDGFEPSTSRL